MKWTFIIDMIKELLKIILLMVMLYIFAVFMMSMGGCAYNTQLDEVNAQCRYEASKHADYDNDYLRWLHLYDQCILMKGGD